MEAILCFEVPHQMGAITIKWATDDKGLKDCSPFLLGHFHFLIERIFLVEIFCSVLLKVHINFQYITFFVLTFDE